MRHENRRSFLTAAAAVLARPAFPVLGANDRVNLGIVGDRRARPRPHRRIRQTTAGPHRRRLRRGPGGPRARRRAGGEAAGIQAQAVLRHAPAVRRQGDRRGLLRHAQPLARPGHHLGLPGGQGRLRGEAAVPQHLRRPEDGRGGAQVQAHGAGGLAEPQHRATSSARWNCCAKASSARSTWPRGCASTAASRSATRRTSPCRPASIGTCSWDPRRCGPSPAIASTTTGTGSGTPATAISATRASMKWTMRAGA